MRRNTKKEQWIKFTHLCTTCCKFEIILQCFKFGLFLPSLVMVLQQVNDRNAHSLRILTCWPKNARLFISRSILASCFWPLYSSRPRDILSSISDERSSSITNLNALYALSWLFFLVLTLWIGGIPQSWRIESNTEGLITVKSRNYWICLLRRRCWIQRTIFLYDSYRSCIMEELSK